VSMLSGGWVWSGRRPYVAEDVEEVSSKLRVIIAVSLILYTLDMGLIGLF